MYYSCFYQLYVSLILFNTFLVLYEKIYFQLSSLTGFYAIHVLLPASSLWFCSAIQCPDAHLSSVWNQ